MRTTDILMALAVTFAIIAKVILLTRLFPTEKQQRAASRPWFFLIAALLCALYIDITWMLKLTRSLGFIAIPYSAVVFSIRIAWGMVVIQYQCLSLFIETLVERHARIRHHHKVLVATSTLFVCYSLFIAFGPNTPALESERAATFALPMGIASLEVLFMHLVPFFVIFMFILPSIIKARIKIRNESLPRILRTQLHLLSHYLYIPYLAGEALFVVDTYINHSINPHLLCSASCVLINGAITYGVLALLRLRFLNLAPQVTKPIRITVMSDFRVSLEQLSHTTNLQELGNITKSFFHDAFGIPLQATELYIRRRQTSLHANAMGQENNAEITVEQYLYLDDAPVCTEIRSRNILLYDEMAFNYFYEATSYKKTVLSFLDAIHADIFVPITKKEKIIGYIIVSRNARPEQCYGKTEHDEMMIFADYLGNAINLIQNRNLEQIIQREHTTQLALQNAQQHIKQFQESIRSFISPEKISLSGVIIYRAKRFHSTNAAAKQIVDIDPNTHSGHPLTHAIKKTIERSETYQAASSTLATNNAGDRIVIRATPSLENNSVILTVQYPGVADIALIHSNILSHDKTQDIQLYLETTRSGHLVNQFIPSNSEELLNVKIMILRAALSQNSLLIQAHEDDREDLINIVHHISERKNLNTITLHEPPENFDVAISIFGVNPNLGVHAPSAPLLEAVENGTLLINNIHYAKRETQKSLAEFIETGLFRPIRSDDRIPSSTRIICTTPHSLETLVEENNFSARLYRALQKNIITIPTPNDLAEDVFADLVDGFCAQAIQTETLRNLLKLSSRDREQLIQKRPKSMHQLKDKIWQTLIKKSKRNELYEEGSFDRGYNLADPDLVKAARLGKHALRDQQMVAMLWDKFKNQNKIASLLGVNRSSVSRRIKEYGLQEH